MAKLAKKVFLCGPNGPTGVSTFVFGAAKGIYYAAHGDGALAAGAAAGKWGGLSGSVLGFIGGGPIGALIGGIAGGLISETTAKVVVEGHTPIVNSSGRVGRDESNLTVHQITIDNGFLGRYRRHPSLRPEIDHSSFEVRNVDGVPRLCWMYEGHCYMVSYDEAKPEIAIVHHYAGPHNCFSQFSLNEDGSISEWNPQLRERWNWIRE